MKKWWYGDGSKPWYLVNPKIAGKWMFIPLKMVLIGIDPYPYVMTMISYWSCGTMGTSFSAEAIVPRCAKSHWLQMIAKDSRLPQGTSMIHQNAYRASTFGPSPSWIFMIHTWTESHYLSHQHHSTSTSLSIQLSWLVTIVTTPRVHGDQPSQPSDPWQRTRPIHRADLFQCQLDPIDFNLNATQLALKIKTHWNPLKSLNDPPFFLLQDPPQHSNVRRPCIEADHSHDLVTCWGNRKFATDMSDRTIINGSYT